MNVNNSVMKCCICSNQNSGEFIIINNKKYHLSCIEELQYRIAKAIEYIENNTYSSVVTMNTTLHLQNDELYDLLEILKGNDSNV